MSRLTARYMPNEVTRPPRSRRVVEVEVPVDSEEEHDQDFQLATPVDSDHESVNSAVKSIVSVRSVGSIGSDGEKRVKSAVWEHWTKGVRDGGRMPCVCKYCG